MGEKFPDLPIKQPASPGALVFSPKHREISQTPLTSCWLPGVLAISFLGVPFILALLTLFFNEVFTDSQILNVQLPKFCSAKYVYSIQLSLNSVLAEGREEESNHRHTIYLGVSLQSAN